MNKQPPEVISKFEFMDSFYVKIKVGNQSYTYKFISQEEWDQYYWFHSYPTNIPSVRKLKFSIIHAIKHLKV